VKPSLNSALTSAFLFTFCAACELPFGTESQNTNVLPEPSASPSAEELSSSAAKKAKANAEIFHEMFKVVFMREPKDRGEFGNWVDTLNQGASLEGVYNGLTHSQEYAALEKNSPKASEKAIKVFRDEINLLELELPVPTHLENFGLASLFLLKRVLSDEALKVIASKSSGPTPKASETAPKGDVAEAKSEDSPKAKLAAWYSKWAVHMAQRNVDFGVPLRNKPDEGFHFKWAGEVSEDQITWEILNRIHRVLNDANR
jgi:hypothetical protein